MVNFFPPLHELGGNREPDSESMKAEILTKIVYPTGGFSQFNYEPNSISTTNEVFQNSSLSLNLLAPSSSSSQSYNITKSQNISITYSFNFSTAYLSDFGNTSTIGTLKLTGPGSTTIFQRAVKKTDLISNQLNDYIYLWTSQVGTYTLSFTSAGGVSSSSDYQFYAVLQYQQSLGNQTVSKMVGGLRLASMFDHDGVNTTNEKYYVYENPFVINPDIFSNYMSNVLMNKICQTPNQFSNKVVRNSSTQFSLGSIQGGTVGYGKVTVLNGLSGINGKTVYEYTNYSDDGVSSSSIFPYPPTDSREFERGLLLTQSEYNSTGVLYQRMTNNYSFVQKVTAMNMKAGYYTIYDCCSNGNGYCGITPTYYNLTTFQVNKTSSTSINYDLTGNNGNVTATNFYYDNPLHTQMTRVETTESDGTKLTAFTVYPKDYPSGTSFIDNLVANNMYFPIEVIKYREDANGSNTRILSGMVVKYLANAFGQKDRVYVLDNNSPVLLSSFKFSNANTGVKPISGVFNSYSIDSRYKERLIFDNYDVNNNLVSYHTKGYNDDLPVSYLWAYKGYYPVAEIKNANWSDVSVGLTAIGSSASTIANMMDATTIQSTLQSLRNNITNGYVTSYSLNAFYGLNNVVAPHSLQSSFGYDDFNRLRKTQDNESNLTNLYRYSYASIAPLAAPLISIANTSQATTSLTASGCTGALSWNNGATTSTITVPTANSTDYYVNCAVGNSTSAYSNSIRIPTLPSTWLSTDVGNPSVAGQTLYAPTNLSISGKGYDLNASNGNSQDQFHYVYKNYTGDVTISVKVSSLIASDGKRVGIMLRNSTLPYSAYYSLCQDGNTSVIAQRRMNDAYPREYVNYTSSLPVNATWLKLVKVGSTVSTYYSTDGSTWQTLNLNAASGLATNFLIGFAVYDNSGSNNQATLSNISISNTTF